MADPNYGEVVASRTYWTKLVKDKNGKESTVTSNTSTGGDETQYRELTYRDKNGAQTRVTEKWSPQKEAWEPQTADTKGGTGAGTLTAQENADANKTRAGASVTRAEAATTNAATGQQRADTAQQRADTVSEYDKSREAWLQGTLNRQNLATEQQIYHQGLQTKVALGQLAQSQADAQLAQWRAGVEAAQAERRLAIEQQNANTSAGNLGVNRGSLGVSQQNADTQREQVIQTASRDAVESTMKLLDRFMPVGPGFAGHFAEGLKTLSSGGGEVNFDAADFQGKMPDLRSIADTAAANAIQRMRGGGGMAPATAAATQATAVPTMPAPAQNAPPPSVTPAVTASSILAGMGPAPTAPGAMPQQLPPYTGPTPGGPANVQ